MNRRVEFSHGPVDGLVLNDDGDIVSRVIDKFFDPINRVGNFIVEGHKYVIVGVTEHCRMLLHKHNQKD